MTAVEYPQPQMAGNAGNGELLNVEEADPAYLRRSHLAT